MFFFLIINRNDYRDINVSMLYLQKSETFEALRESLLSNYLPPDNSSTLLTMAEIDSCLQPLGFHASIHQVQLCM